MQLNEMYSSYLLNQSIVQCVCNFDVSGRYLSLVDIFVHSRFCYCFSDGMRLGNEFFHLQISIPFFPNVQSQIETKTRPCEVDKFK